MTIKMYTENEKKMFEVYVNGYGSGGRRYQKRIKNIESLKKAQTIEFECKRELALLKEERVPYRWHEWFTECMNRMKLEFMPTTIAGYEAQIKKWVHPHWAMREIQTITKQDVHSLIYEKCDEMRTQYTRRNVLKMVKRIFQMAVEDGVLDRNPSAGVSVRVNQVDQKVLADSDVRTFLREAKAANHKFYPIWFVALSTGMRSGELMGLQWCDIDFDTRMITLRRQWTSKTGFIPTKTRRNRIVPINPELLGFLKELRMKSDPSREFVLPHHQEWMHGEQARITRDFCKAVGIPEVKFHDLRATFITSLLGKGVPLAQVMAMVGHTELKTTNSYLRLTGLDIRGATDGLKILPGNVEGSVLALVTSPK